MPNIENNSIKCYSSRVFNAYIWFKSNEMVSKRTLAIDFNVYSLNE